MFMCCFLLYIEQNERSKKKNLKLFCAFGCQFGKVDSSAKKDVGGFGNSVDLPAQVLEKR
jgi:hypothetical protein